MSLGMKHAYIMLWPAVKLEVLGLEPLAYQKEPITKTHSNEAQNATIELVDFTTLYFHCLWLEKFIKTFTKFQLDR